MSNSPTICSLLDLPDPYLERRFKFNKNEYRTERLDEATIQYWQYRGKLNMFYQTLNQLPRTIFSAALQPLFGIEVETENIAYKRIDDKQPHGWVIKEDSSLRHGLEFMSYPGDYEESRHLLASLYLFFVEQLKRKPNFSWRTSEHVHLNVRWLNREQLGNFILLYCVFEKLLFKFSGESRENSIFCVPITESSPDIIQYILSSSGLRDYEAVVYLADGWEKYSALNLFRLRDLGTIEFRHFGGTWETEKLMLWLQLIGKLLMSASTMKQEYIVSHLKNLNSLSNYGEFKNEVFGFELGRILGEPKNFISLLSHGVSFAKECVVFPKKYTLDLNTEAGRWANRIVEKVKKLPKSEAPKKKKPAEVSISFADMVMEPPIISQEN